MCYTKEQIKTAVKSKGYKWFEDASNKTYDVNIVGVRNNTPGIYKKVTNVFDDCLTVSFKDAKLVEQFYCWKATCDPGKKGVEQFHNKNGVARLVPGQYRGAYALSLHQGKYEAVCQRLQEVTVWRDDNKDLTFDEVKQDTGMFGINIHKSGVDSTWVENWSEGCQVFKRVKDFNEFISICKKAAKVHGNHFTYTLIESSDIKQ
jgi:hypothetical protein